MVAWLAGIALCFAIVFSTSLAGAQILDDDDDSSAMDDDDDAPAADGVVDEMEPAVEHGVGIRLRNVFVPQAMIELFVEEAASGMSTFGFGIDYVRRKGDFELVLGFEYENVSPDDGFYLEKGDVAPGEPPDRIVFDGLAWATLDVAFVFHKELHEKFALRYGAGFGLGIVLGEVLQTDSVCTSADIQNDCTVVPPGTPGAQINDPSDDVPPVFPVVNIILGAQYRPAKNITINLEGGMRSLFFVGLSSAFFF